MECISNLEDSAYCRFILKRLDLEVGHLGFEMQARGCFVSAMNPYKYRLLTPFASTVVWSPRPRSDALNFGDLHRASDGKALELTAHRRDAKGPIAKP